MSRVVTQVIDQTNGDTYGGGTVTVIATDENGYQYVGTRTYDYSYQRDSAISEATKEALNKY